MAIICSVCKTQIDVQSLIDVQSSNRRSILKYMAVFEPEPEPGTETGNKDKNI